MFDRVLVKKLIILFLTITLFQELKNEDLPSGPVEVPGAAETPRDPEPVEEIATVPVIEEHEEEEKEEERAESQVLLISTFFKGLL